MTNWFLLSYFRFLYYHVLLPNQLAEWFFYLSPHKLSIYETRHSQYIADALLANDKPNRVFFAPYNCGWVIILINLTFTFIFYEWVILMFLNSSFCREHWVLIVINTSEAAITYYDSMHGDPSVYTHMKNLFES